MSLWIVTHRVRVTAVSCLLALQTGAAGRPPMPAPVRLRCQYRENPLGVDRLRPQLGWVLESAPPEWRQGACQVLVATSPARLEVGKADLWDSGVVASRPSVQVAYGGRPLTSGLRCHWKVRVWDEAGTASPWSRPAWWEMGLLRPEDWQARWIGAGPTREPRPAAGFFKSTNELATVSEPVTVDGRSTLLRKEFRVRAGLRRARVHVTGVGYYELTCNGRRVGDSVLAPAKTNYRQWVLYDTYDLAPLLEPGANALGLQLGNGWFNPARKWWDPYRMQWFGSKRALVQLELEYADGTSDVVVSDGSWKSAPGPVEASCVYDGESYDATKEVAGWDRTGFDERSWEPAHLVEPPGGKLVATPMPPIRVVEHLKPVALRSPKPGVWIYDLGQNFAGWARLAVSGPRGTRIVLRHAEDLAPSGELDPRSNERAQATDVYVLKGQGREVYEPRFTFHGFRYVEVTGHPGVPRRGDLLGCVVQTDCAATGSLACDHALVNRIHRATVWSQRSCMLGYPLDCPQRDERLGWFGDAMVSMEEALFNFDALPFFRHWLEGVRYNQNPANGDISIVSPRPYVPDEPDPTWSSAYIAMVWRFYVHTGDRQFLEEHFEAMRRYVDYLGTQATNYVLPKYWIGDWGTTVKGWQEGEPVSVATAFYYLDTGLLARAAGALGRTADAERYGALARGIKAAFRRAFHRPDRHQFDQGTQFSNALALALGLAEEDERAGVLRNILDDLQRQGGHFDVGVLGAKYLPEALTQEGHADAAWQLVNRTGHPGWARMLEGGRTTLSEFWDLHGSHNHVMMGSIDAWFYRTLAGIQPDESRPGFERVAIRPFVPPSIGSLEASVETVRGRVRVAWEKRRGEFRLRVSLPANSGGTVHVPAGASNSVRCRPPRSPAWSGNGAVVYELGSGDYEFRVAPAPQRKARCATGVTPSTAGASGCGAPTWSSNGTGATSSEERSASTWQSKPAR